MEWFAEFYRSGGTFMHFIAICGLYVLGVSLYKFIILFVKMNTNGANLMKQIQKLVISNNVEKAIKVCDDLNSAALAKVLKAGLSRANRGELEIQNAMEEATLEVAPKVTSLLPSVFAISSTATMFGLLGTVFGLIDAFDAVAHAAPEQKSAMLASGIAIAMNTTGWGLLIAIPGTILNLFLNGLAGKIMSDLDLYTVKLSNLLTSREKTAE